MSEGWILIIVIEVARLSNANMSKLLKLVPHAMCPVIVPTFLATLIRRLDNLKRTRKKSGKGSLKPKYHTIIQSYNQHGHNCLARASRVMFSSKQFGPPVTHQHP
jgi:hypothetical protein